MGSEAKERPKDGDYGSTLWGALGTEWVTPQGGGGICTTVPVSHWVRAASQRTQVPGTPSSQCTGKGSASSLRDPGAGS